MAALLIGYARVSTDEQDLTVQRDALAALGVAADRIYVDHGLTGTNRERPGLQVALAACRAGDTLVVTKLDRLARSLPDAREILEDLTRREVRLSLGGSVHDPTDPVGRLLFNVLAMVAEFEADLIRLRTREGMKIAKAKGRLGTAIESFPPGSAVLQSREGGSGLPLQCQHFRMFRSSFVHPTSSTDMVAHMLVANDRESAGDTPQHTHSINRWVPLDHEQVPQLEVPEDQLGRLTHQLFRFPAKFHAPVVRELIARYTEPGQRLLDCFCGSGTLLIEAAVSGRHCVGADIDPLSVFLANVKAQPVDLNDLQVAADRLLGEIASLRRPADEYRRRATIADDIGQAQFDEEAKGLWMPAIPRLHYWFRRYVLIDLARLHAAIGGVTSPGPINDVLRLVFASIVRGVSNADPVPVSGLERTRHIRERDERGRVIDPFALYMRKLQRALRDIADYQGLRQADAQPRAILADATEALWPHVGAVDVARPEDDDSSEDEFHARDGDAIPESSDTWTLAVMSALKARGQSVSPGRLRHMLRSALPLGDTITLVLNNEPLTPTKINVPLQGQWVIGSDFAPTTITPEGAADDAESVPIRASAGQDPHVDIPGLGRVTGEIKLYQTSIAGGKSVERGASNGFHVNVRGRVINTWDEHFGMPALSHGVWAKLRVTVRADGLNEDLAVSRESVEDSDAVRRFRGFLRAAFNFARANYPEAVALPDIHELLADRWGTVPISPLVHVVDVAVSSDQAADLVDLHGVDQGDAAAQEVRNSIEEHPEDALRTVSAQPYGRDKRLARYRVADRSVVINSDHPYWIEQLTSADTDKKEVLTTAATVSLLGDAYLVELGVAPELVDDLRDYRDQVERLIASSRRRSALTLASLLDEASTERMSLENLVAECLEHLGFHIQHQAQTGKPEGIATADLAPDAEERARRYRFIYEAKSTNAADRKVSTKDVNVSGQDRHRRQAAKDTDDTIEVEHALVVAPGFQSGALEDECEALNVCPCALGTSAG